MNAPYEQTRSSGSQSEGAGPERWRSAIAGQMKACSYYTRGQCGESLRNTDLIYTSFCAIIGR